MRADLCDEAIRLARLVVELLPDEPEAHGLLALLLLTDARRPARTDADGLPVSLEDQDRSRWDRDAIAEGTAVLDHALALGEPGPFQVQAAVAALHAEAPTWDSHRLAADRRALRRARTARPVPVVTSTGPSPSRFADGPHVGLACSRASSDDDTARPLPAAPRHPSRAPRPRRRPRRRRGSAYRRAIDLTRTPPNGACDAPGPNAWDSALRPD